MLQSPSTSSNTEGVHVAKRPRLCGTDTRLFQGLPREVRVRILQFASIDDLASFAMVSRQSREDCRDESLSQTRTAVIICRYSTSFWGVLTKIRNSENMGVFSTFSGLKLVNHAGLPRVNTREARFITRHLNLTTKTSLDLSLPPGVLRGRKKDRQVAACIPKTLSKIMPNLRHVDMSNVQVAQSALSDFARNCPNLETIRWDYCNATSAFASGQDLKNCHNLKELYMDHAHFYVPNDADHVKCLFDEPNDPFCVLWFCKRKLERVSLKEATYYVYPKRNKAKPLSQLGLVKFVRGAENLRWFRSDLNTENITMLQKERPEITFVS